MTYEEELCQLSLLDATITVRLATHTNIYYLDQLHQSCCVTYDCLLNRVMQCCVFGIVITQLAPTFASGYARRWQLVECCGHVPF